MLKKIVDVHCHVMGNEKMISEEIANLFAKMLPWNCGLPTPEVLLKNLDEAGVTYAVLQAYDLKDAGLDIPNDYVAELLRQYPDRFICGYASADPIKRGTANAIAMLKDGYDMGLRGLKLHPILMQFSPDNKDLYPLYYKCIEYDIPVGFHIQPVPGSPTCRLKFCNIVSIDELAHDLPELKIQICHFGKYPMLPDALDLAACLMNNKNVYTDMSATIPMTKDGIMNTLHLVKQLNIVDKCMFGTDFPVQPQIWWTECVEKVNFTDEEKTKIMCDNALRFVGREDLLD
jgi:uncharacterized protein